METKTLLHVHIQTTFVPEMMSALTTCRGTPEEKPPKNSEHSTVDSAENRLQCMGQQLVRETSSMHALWRRMGRRCHITNPFALHQGQHAQKSTTTHGEMYGESRRDI